MFFNVLPKMKAKPRKAVEMGRRNSESVTPNCDRTASNTNDQKITPVVRERIPNDQKQSKLTRDVLSIMKSVKKCGTFFVNRLDSQCHLSFVHSFGSQLT